MKNTSLKKIFQLLLLILISELAGIIGSVFTRSSVKTWYAALNKPFFNPPSWIFAPVWILLYLLMGISAFLILQKGIKKKEVKIALSIFGMQLLLNALWSFLFFGLKSPFYGLVGIIILWIAISANIVSFYKIEKTAAYLLLPYILWVSYAAVLNLSIFIINL